MGSVIYRKTLVKLIKQECGDNPKLGVEIGVHRGGLSNVLLSEFPDLTLMMADLWEEWTDIWEETTAETLEVQKNHRKVAMRRTQFAESRRDVIIKDSVEAAAECEKANKHPDFTFIDADHSYEGCLRDMEAWWPITKSLFAGHDYDRYKWPGVVEAVADFCDKHKLTFNTGRGTIWWISKK